ncbi:MAG: ABC transporter permease [Bryobacterales bacterium]|nr:ABC transporter permease [Bryobacterales bacterium]
MRTIGPASFAPGQVGNYLSRLFEYGDLLLTLTHHRIRVRYKQSALGLAWALLQPLSLMLIYTVIFSVVTRIPSDGTPYAVFVYAALLPWTLFSTGLTSAVGGLVSHTHLITKVYFPREILPLSYVLAAIFDFLTASLVLAAMMAYYGIVPSVHIFWTIPILGLGVCVLTSLSLMLSAMQVWVRDIGIAMPLVLQLWMFATPVVYPLSAVPQWLRGYYILNPMTGVIENFRRVVLQNTAPDMPSLLASALFSVLMLPVAYLYFKQREATMADVI